MNFIKKNIEHFGNFLDYVIEHLLCIFVLILVFIISFAALKASPLSMPKDVQSQEIYIWGISLNNLGIYFTIVGLIITAFWSTYQFVRNTSRNQQEKGAEISKMVSQVLLTKCTILGSVILKSELNDIFNFDDLKPSTFRNFDNNELMKLFKEPDRASIQIKSILTSNDIQQIYFRVLETNISQQDYNDLSDKKYDDEEARKLFILDNANLPFSFLELINSTLNDLEYISMYIASQSTDSKYVYQSLHQFFLRTVKILAPIICLQNKNYSDKYYVNIIHVYNYWCYLRNLDKKREDKNEEKIKKILNPKIKKV